MTVARYSDLITEQGHLRDDVKPYMRDHIEKEVEALLACAQNESQLRTIGSVIITVIQTMVADKVVRCYPSKTKSISP